MGEEGGSVGLSELMILQKADSLSHFFDPEHVSSSLSDSERGDRCEGGLSPSGGVFACPRTDPTVPA